MIRQSYNSLISTVWFPILVRQHVSIESGPRLLIVIAKILVLGPLALLTHWIRGAIGIVNFLNLVEVTVIAITHMYKKIKMK